MRTYKVTSNIFDGYSVSPCATRTGVLIQLTSGSGREQIRILLKKSEVEHMIELLQDAKEKVYEN
jgi:hypothetical protein